MTEEWYLATYEADLERQRDSDQEKTDSPDWVEADD